MWWWWWSVFAEQTYQKGSCPTRKEVGEVGLPYWHRQRPEAASADPVQDTRLTRPTFAAWHYVCKLGINCPLECSKYEHWAGALLASGVSTVQGEMRPHCGCLGLTSGAQALPEQGMGKERAVSGGPSRNSPGRRLRNVVFTKNLNITMEVWVVWDNLLQLLVLARLGVKGAVKCKMVLPLEEFSAPWYCYCHLSPALLPAFAEQ